MNQRNRLLHIYITCIITGLVAIALQLSLIRETLAIYQAGEFSVPWIIGLWLIFTAVGNKLGVAIPPRSTCLSILFATFCLVAPLTLTIFRLNPLGGYQVSGEMLNPSILFITTALLQLPACLLNGILFTLPVRLVLMENTHHNTHLTWTHPRMIYIAETAGALLGAMLLTFTLPMGTAYLFIFGITAILAGLIYCALSFKRTGIILLAAGSTFCCVNNATENTVTQRHWPDQTIQGSFFSPYGRYDLIKSGSESVLYLNRSPQAGNEPDQTTETLCCLLRSLQNQSTETIVIEGAMKHLSRYFCLNDSSKMTIYTQDTSALNWYRNRASTPRLDFATCANVTQTNPRNMLRNLHPDSIDVLLCMNGAPDSLINSRYYSVSFFHDVFQALNSHGLLAFSLPGGATTMNSQQTELVQLVFNTLNRVFQPENVLLLPGDPVLIFAQKNRSIASIAPEVIVDQFHKLNIETHYPQASIIEDRLNPFNRSQLMERLAVEPNGAICTDNRPIAFSIYQTQFHSLWDTGILAPLEIIQKNALKILICFAVIGIVWLVFQRHSPNRLCLSFSVITGCTTITTEIILLFQLQTFSGALYRGAGLLIACCTTGLVLGALLSSRFPSRLNWLPIPLAANGALIVFVAVVPAFSIPSFNWSLYFLAVLSGIAGGLFFGAATLQFPSKTPEFYIADLAGAACGSMFIGLVLLPAAGIVLTGICLGVLNFAPLFLLKFFKNP